MERLSNYSLPPDIQEMIDKGNSIREQGGDAYIDALRDERRADRQGQGLPSVEIVPVSMYSERQSDIPPQEQAERKSDECKGELASYPGPIGIDPVDAARHNERLDEVRRQLGQ